MVSNWPSRPLDYLPNFRFRIAAVVPDSGTDQLAGLAGTMAINIVDGKHFYDFAYTIAEMP